MRSGGEERRSGGEGEERRGEVKEKWKRRREEREKWKRREERRGWAGFKFRISPNNSVAHPKSCALELSYPFF